MPLPSASKLMIFLPEGFQTLPWRSQINSGWRRIWISRIYCIHEVQRWSLVDWWWRWMPRTFWRAFSRWTCVVKLGSLEARGGLKMLPRLCSKLGLVSEGHQRRLRSWSFWRGTLWPSIRTRWVWHQCQWRWRFRNGLKTEPSLTLETGKLGKSQLSFVSQTPKILQENAQ